ncbi:hypothetical protein TNCV_2657541 [Trichonephila clavipes]|uniref:Mos1 transposase HTH domain-containing protein n=1 Tax=Trichonephila clavipes TaxID=2585209 RepID=A0A8X6RDW3_TRICX|nr:hypothetical protein TNCV_2657541 [Trichonephila clavipes]
MIFVEQIMNIKFCILLEKSDMMTYKICKHVYGSDILSRTQVFEWHRGFREGKESDEDDGRLFGHHHISHTTEIIEKVSVVARKQMLQQQSKYQNLRKRIRYI